MGIRRVRNGPLIAASGRAALFLDRDGVLNEPVWDERSASTESPLEPFDVILAAGAADAVRRANVAGLPVVVVSNQPSAAKGIVDESTVRAVHARVLDLLTAKGAVINQSYLCLHHPLGVVAALTRTCECRKPAPGMLLQAAAELDLDLSRCWLIGDTDADLAAARRALLDGVVLVENPLSAHRRTALSESADATTSTISAAIDIVLDRML